jgi:hypothetical protein
MRFQTPSPPTLGRHSTARIIGARQAPSGSRPPAPKAHARRMPRSGAGSSLLAAPNLPPQSGAAPCRLAVDWPCSLARWPRRGHPAPHDVSPDAADLDARVRIGAQSDQRLLDGLATGAGPLREQQSLASQVRDIDAMLSCERTDACARKTAQERRSCGTQGWVCSQATRQPPRLACHCSQLRNC